MSTDIEKKEQDEKDKKELQIIKKDLPAVVITAHGLQIQSAENVEGARALSAVWQQRIDFAENLLRPNIKKANELHKSMLKDLAFLQDPYTEAIKVIEQEKISPYYDEVERKKKKATDLKAAEELKNSHLRIAAAQNTINELMEGITDTTDQINVLTVRLHNEELEEEEAAICRSMIETLQNSKADAKQAAETAVQQTRESAIPSADTIPTKVKTAKGVGEKRYKCVGVNNPLLLIRTVAEKTLGVGIIKFDLVAISKLKNLGNNVPGAIFKEVRAFRKAK